MYITADIGFLCLCVCVCPFTFTHFGPHDGDMFITISASLFMYKSKHMHELMRNNSRAHTVRTLQGESPSASTRTQIRPTPKINTHTHTLNMTEHTFYNMRALSLFSYGSIHIQVFQRIKVHFIFFHHVC